MPFFPQIPPQSRQRVIRYYSLLLAGLALIKLLSVCYSALPDCVWCLLVGLVTILLMRPIIRLVQGKPVHPFSGKY